MQTLIFGCLFIYSVIALILYLVQDRFIFYPTKLAQNYPFDEFPEAEERFFETEPGIQINALHFKVDNPKGTIYYLHGNARGLDSWGLEAANLTRFGYNLLMPDYRGYGKSSGKASEANMHKDCLFIYNQLKSEISESDIIVYGRSLGSGVATQLATKVNPAFLILETPLLSITTLAQKTIKILPVALLLNTQFRNDKFIDKINCPVHMFHGTEDELIPYRDAVELAKIIPGKDHLTTIPGGTHNNLSTYDAFNEKLEEILSNVMC